MLEMVSKFWKGSMSRRRAVLESFRDEAASCGYRLDDTTDDQLEAALTDDGQNLEKLPPFTGRKVYWTLRRIASEAKTFACETRAAGSKTPLEK